MNPSKRKEFEIQWFLNKPFIIIFFFSKRKKIGKIFYVAQDISTIVFLFKKSK